MAAGVMARSSYYYWSRANEVPDLYARAKDLIKEIFHQHKGRYGYRRIMLALRHMGCWLNHKTVRKLMGELKLKSVVRPKRYKSYRGDMARSTPNTLAREFEATKPNEKWVTDVTEFFHGKKFESVEAFKTGLDEYMKYYNHDRIKEKLKGLSPVQYRIQSLKVA